MRHCTTRIGALTLCTSPQAEYERMMYHLLGRPAPEPAAEPEAPPPPTAEPPPTPVQGQRRRRRCPAG